ncbi:MAG: hypothetical protein ACI9U2_004440 [Bradymonadia bacterium]
MSTTRECNLGIPVRVLNTDNLERDLMRLNFEHSYADELDGLYVSWTPPGFAAPSLLYLNDDLFSSLGLSDEVRSHAAEVFSGTLLSEDAQPIAQAYAGHQFGGFSPILGDGRAALLGEVIDTQGVRQDIHLKGVGRTPFSRGGDGKATVGPILREALVAEAMHALGVPTSRVLAAVLTGETVRREGLLPGAVLARVATSHLRVGHVQFLAARRDRERLAKLVDYAVQRHYPQSVGAASPACALIEAVARSQAALIARWMSVGFVHGVMNTDNFTLSGQTIDYGPCAFLDTYDADAVFSSIDRNSRYAFSRQPAIGQWNLTRLAEALLPLLADDEAEAIAIAQTCLEVYPLHFEAEYSAAMRRKLGLNDAHDDDPSLIGDLLAWMQKNARDFTQTFRGLSAQVDAPHSVDPEFIAWHARWRLRLGSQAPADIAARLDRVNPIYIPRNHLVEEALNAAIAGDLAPFERLLSAVQAPFVEQPGLERYGQPAPTGFGPYRTFCGT